MPPPSVSLGLSIGGRPFHSSKKVEKNQTAVYDSQVLWVPQVPWKTKMRQKQPVSISDLNTPEI